MIRDHAAAAVAAVNATNATCYDSDEVPNLPVMPYVLLYTDLGLGVDGRFPDVYTSRRFRVVAQFYGNTADEARWAAEQTWYALDGVALTVTDRVCTKARIESTTTILPDLDDEDVFFGTAVWVFASRPA